MAAEDIFIFFQPVQYPNGLKLNACFRLIFIVNNLLGFANNFLIIVVVYGSIACIASATTGFGNGIT